MRRLLPTPADHVDPRAEYAVEDGRQWLRANMVASVDGAVTDADGKSAGISGVVDRRVFGVLRALSDAIVVGARTAQVERYRRASRPIVLLSRTLTVDLTTPLLGPPEGERNAAVLLVAPEAAWATFPEAASDHLRATVGIERLVAGDDELDLDNALAQLRSRGLAHLLCEGGPSLLAALTQADLIDELCLTTSPFVVGGPGGLMPGHAMQPAPRPCTLTAAYEAEGFLFTRWNLRNQ